MSCKCLIWYTNLTWCGLGCALLLANTNGCYGGDGPSESSGSASRGINPNSEAGLPAGVPGSPKAQIRPASKPPSPGDGTGAFRTTCLFSHMRHDDPIVFPQEAGASHLHAFFGNTGANAASTAESLRSTGNSTCRGGIVNRSAYWVPVLRDAGGDPLTPEPAQIYYKSGYYGIAPDEVQAFPQGLRMIAGDSRASSAQSATGWICEGREHEPSASVPECPAGRRVVMQVEFPQCWNGNDLDSSDHKRHMAYPEEGRCPASHPVPIPVITFNVPYRVPEQGSAGLRLDSDHYDTSQPGGYSAHGDWFEAWDPEVVDIWIANCINAGVDCHSHLLGDGREIYFEGGEP